MVPSQVESRMAPALSKAWDPAREPRSKGALDAKGLRLTVAGRLTLAAAAATCCCWISVRTDMRPCKTAVKSVMSARRVALRERLEMANDGSKRRGRSL